jgi:YfiH family protein
MIGSMPKKNIDNRLITPHWPAPANIKALATTRYFSTDFAGYSHGSFQGFNLGGHVGDDKLAVENNRQLLQGLFADSQPLQWLNQVHGNRVVVIDKSNLNQVFSADAMVTRDSRLPLAILTADCLPVLLCDKHAQVVAAVHCGWRSLAANILVHTLSEMAEDPANIIAWLGPCIGPEHFEVGQDVFDEFCKISPELKQNFTSASPGKYFGDLQALTRQQLTGLGVRQIDSLQDCTYSMANKYFSYRRDPKSGRMATVICKY